MDTQELQHTTKLSPAQQAAREALVKQWVARVLAVVKESACSVRLALLAIEEADRDQPTRR